jgi:glycosyltransferase involved in cell wall biosynthesis
MTVSVALIVKNEARSLARCLDSVAGAVDEIVVVDTGSTDDTKEIARRYTARVFDFEWRQDFSAARQFAIDQATSDWVFWIDADDVVQQAEEIRPLLEAAPADVAGFYWRYEYDRDLWGNAVCEFWRERCVRNDGTFRWEGRVHEVLAQQRPCKLVQSSAIVVRHHRDRELITKKIQRNLEILEWEYASLRGSNTKPPPRLLFYLASEQASAGDCQQAIFFYQQYLNSADWDDERYLAQTRVAGLYRLQGRYEQAINADLQALKTCPHWPDAYFGLAETYYYKRDWHRTVHWAELGRAMPQPDTLHILNPMDYRFNWIIFYTNALFHVGETREALDWTRRALGIKPDDQWHRENFLTFTRALEEERIAAGFSKPTTAESSHFQPPSLIAEEPREPLRVVWEGPQLMRGSFAFVNRNMCSALLQLNVQGQAHPAQISDETALRLADHEDEVDCLRPPPLELSIVPHGPFEFGVEEDPERFGALTASFNATLSGPVDVHVTMSYVPEPEPPREGKWIVCRPWEFSRMPRAWFDLFETYADEVWVPSWFVWRCYIESGVSPDKVHVVPHGVDPEIFHPLAPATPLRTEKTFKFVFVGGTIWRKGIDILLEAYRRAFSPADDVCLVIKDLAADSYYREHNARESIQQLQRDPAAPRILYLTEDVADREVAGLYTACDCLVHPFRGEGFALPVVEAMACGLPTILTRGGPCEDYCSDETSYWISAETTSANLWEETVEPANILEPDVEELIEALRYVFAHRDEARAKGATASQYIRQNYTWGNAARIALERFEHLTGRACDAANDPAQFTYALAQTAILPSVGAPDSPRANTREVVT